MGANAQTSVPAFTAGQVLTAAQVTQINTGIPVFASSTERDAAFGGTGEKTLAEGQMAYLEDTNATQYYDGSSWAAVAGGKIFQVVSTTKTDTFTTSASSYTDITGLSVSITPSSATSKVFVIATIQGNGDAASKVGFLQLVRDSTAIAIGDAASNRTRVSAAMYEGDVYALESAVITYLDAPATTSATTYKIQGFSDGATVLYVNRSENDTDASYSGRAASTITAVEVSA